MGTPSLKMPGSEMGAFCSYTDAGPPDKTMPFGFCAFSFSTGVLNGTISVYTFASRILRPISCVYCPPKSRMSIVSNCDDILPHYSNRRESYEEQVTVQHRQKQTGCACCSEHHHCIRQPRHIEEPRN